MPSFWHHHPGGLWKQTPQRALPVPQSTEPFCCLGFHFLDPYCTGHTHGDPRWPQCSSSSTLKAMRLAFMISTLRDSLAGHRDIAKNFVQGVGTMLSCSLASSSLLRRPMWPWFWVSYAQMIVHSPVWVLVFSLSSVLLSLVIRYGGVSLWIHLGDPFD